MKTVAQPDPMLFDNMKAVSNLYRAHAHRDSNSYFVGYEVWNASYNKYREVVEDFLAFLVAR